MKRRLFLRIFSLIVTLFVPLMAGADDAALQLPDIADWDCNDLLTINVKLEGASSTCGALNCSNNVLTVYDGLPPKIQKETKIMIVAPLDSAAGLTPMMSRFGKSFWTFHAVLIYKGRIIDPAASKTGLPYTAYLPQMFAPKELAQSAIWIFSKEDYQASIQRNGWLFIFSDLLLTKPDLYVARLMPGFALPTPAPSVHLKKFKNINPGTAVQVRYWVTPSQDLKQSYIECHEGILVVAKGRAIVVSGQRGTVQVPFEAVQSLRMGDEFKSSPIFSHWWKTPPAYESPCITD